MSEIYLSQFLFNEVGGIIQGVQKIFSILHNYACSSSSKICFKTKGKRSIMKFVTVWRWIRYIELCPPKIKHLNVLTFFKLWALFKKPRSYRNTFLNTLYTFSPMRSEVKCFLSVLWLSVLLRALKLRRHRMGNCKVPHLIISAY